MQRVLPECDRIPCCLPCIALRSQNHRRCYMHFLHNVNTAPTRPAEIMFFIELPYSETNDSTWSSIRVHTASSRTDSLCGQSSTAFCNSVAYSRPDSPTACDTSFTTNVRKTGCWMFTVHCLITSSITRAVFPANRPLNPASKSRSAPSWKQDWRSIECRADTNRFLRGALRQSQWQSDYEIHGHVHRNPSRQTCNHRTLTSEYLQAGRTSLACRTLYRSVDLTTPKTIGLILWMANA